MAERLERLMKLEPTVWRSLLVGLVGLLLDLGIVLAPGLPDSILGVLLPVQAIVQAILIRPAVTANARVAVYMPDPEDRPTLVKSGEADASGARDALILAAAKQ